VEAARALAAIDERLAGAGYETGHTTVAGGDVLVARRSDFRWSWVATRLHTFVVVFTVPHVDVATAEALTGAAQQYAIDNKGGLPRGLQTGTATIAVFLSQADSPAVRPWFSQSPTPRFGAARLPVLVELASGTATHFSGRLRFGAIYSAHIQSVVAEVVAAAV
jgi:hypothetical protein